MPSTLSRRRTFTTPAQATLLENLVLDPSFEYDTTSSAPSTTLWTFDNVDLSTASIAVSTAWSQSGTKSLLCTGTTSGASGQELQVYTPTNNLMPVTPGLSYSASAVVNVASVGGTTNLQLSLVFYNAANTVISLVGPNISSPAVEIYPLEVTAVAPVGAVGAQILIQMFGSTTGGSSPVNTVAPVITGSTTEGTVLSCSQGTWSNAPTSYTYVWAGAGTPNTNSTYTTVAGDVGNHITCSVTAINAYGSAPASSNSFGPIVTSGGSAPTNTAAPVASGGTTVGSTLSVTNGTWNGTAPITYGYAWNGSGSPKTNATYTAVSGDVGNDISCTITATNAYGQNTAHSNSIGPITSGGGGGTYQPSAPSAWASKVNGNSIIFDYDFATLGQPTWGEYFTNGWTQQGGTSGDNFANSNVTFTNQGMVFNVTNNGTTGAMVHTFSYAASPGVEWTSGYIEWDCILYGGDGSLEPWSTLWVAAPYEGYEGTPTQEIDVIEGNGQTIWESNYHSPSYDGEHGLSNEPTINGVWGKIGFLRTPTQYYINWHGISVCQYAPSDGYNPSAMLMSTGTNGGWAAPMTASGGVAMIIARVTIWEWNGT